MSDRKAAQTTSYKENTSSESEKSETPPRKRVRSSSGSSSASKRIKTKPAKKPPANPKQTIIKSETPIKTESVKSSVKTENKQDDDEEKYKWWKDEQRDDSVKWETLEHMGPVFPPAYVPHNVKMIYDGSPVVLSPDAEEVATFYAGVVGTEHAANPTFNANFFNDFMDILKQQHDPTPIRSFEKCDFTPIVEHLARLKEARKQKTKPQKQAEKSEKEEMDRIYGWAVLNGRREKVGNYRIEPPGLFRGRGEHPKTGTLKTRVLPEQVTINIGEDAKIPEPPAGHTWGSVQHDSSVTWLATWKDNVNDNIKYVFLAANSSLKGQSDFKKFEKARELKKVVDSIRESYTEELKDKVMAVRQRATAMYLIDKLALRAGNEKGDEEADTVGCCSLRFEHITLEQPNKVIFDFLGKDSIRYYNEVAVDNQVFKNLKLFKNEPKKEGDALFDRLTTQTMNKHLSTCMPGLTAKVFRTFNASFTFQNELAKTGGDGTVAEKILAYNRANRQVAVLCNHQRSVPKAHGSQMGKLADKIRVFEYERCLIASNMLSHDPKLKKKRPELVEASEEFQEGTDETKQVVLGMQKSDVEKMRKKIERSNEKIQSGEAEGTIVDPKELDEMLKSHAKECGAVSMKDKIEKMTEDRLEKRYNVLTQKIDQQKLLQVDKEEGKTTALGTSKINYLDPRISAAWAHKHDVPIEKIFNATLRDKFTWAMDADADWEF